MTAKISCPALRPTMPSIGAPVTLGLLLAALLMGVLWSVIAASVHHANDVRAAAGGSLRERLACESHALHAARRDCVLGVALASRASRP